MACRVRLIVVVIMVLAVRPLATQTDGPHGIDHHNRLLVVRARAEGKTEACVLVVTTPHSAPAVIHQASAIGAQVVTRFDDIGYFRACLPIATFSQLRSMPGVLGVRIDTDGLQYGADQGTDDDAVTLIKNALGPRPHPANTSPPPFLTGAQLTAGSPLVPMADMGVLRFKREHPTFDGRGVTIAVLERGVLDLTHPTLQEAKALTGESAPKIRGILTPSSYVVEPDDRQLDRRLAVDYLRRSRRHRVQRTGRIDALADTFVIEGQTYHAPTPGTYYFGLYASPYFDRPYSVLWDRAGGTVWVDTNRDFDFRNETPLHDFNTSHEISNFPPDSTASTPMGSVAFAVAFDSAGQSVFVYKGISSHQTMTASLAAGVHFVGGTSSASAPGAQLLLVNAGRTVGEVLEGFIRAARDPRVDLITCSFSSGSFPEVGESIVALVLDRVVSRYGKPIFASAGNTGPRLALPIEPADAPHVMSVGGYAGAETYRAHYGWKLEQPDWLLPYSARGPTANGAMKPDLVAPVLSIAAASCSDDPETTPYLLYSLPRCYMLADGTSAAAPTAAGAAALLISGAKQARLPYDGNRIAWALRMGARALRGYAVNEQGRGLIDVPRAWQLLQRDIDLPEIASEAPVNNRLSPYLRRPGRGAGLYEREGWAPGDTGTRIITLTRTSGSPNPTSYSLRWRGNDGTFAAGASVMLPLNVPASVPVRIAPRSPGVHSGALEVVDRSSGEVIREILATIVAAYQLGPANGYTVRVAVRTPWPRSASVFVHVPPGAQMLRVELRVARGRLRLQAEDPATMDILAEQYYRKGYLYPVEDRYVAPSEAGTQLFPSPTAGVWEFGAAPMADPNPIFGGDSAQYRVPAEAEIVATVLEAEAGNVDHAGCRQSREPTDSAAHLKIAFVNQLGPIGQARATTALGVRRIITGIVDSTQPGPAYEIHVDPGTTSLRVSVRPTDDTTAYLDLYLYTCVTGACHLWEVNVIHGTTSSLLVRAPAAGTWKAIIDPARVPAGRASFTYTEIVTHPTYGRVELTSGTGPCGTGEPCHVEGNVQVTQVAPNGTDLVAVVELIDETAEAAERYAPLAVFGGMPYRPVAVGTAVVAVGDF